MENKENNESKESKEKTYKMKFECRNCGHTFVEEIPHGKQVRTRISYPNHIAYYGFNLTLGTKIVCPRCGVDGQIYPLREG